MLPENKAIKMLGTNRVGGYMMLWGSPAQKDLDQEYFTAETEDLTTMFKAMGKLPFLYNHATDNMLKSEVIGFIDVMESDAVGMWYEATLSQHNKYIEAVRKLVKRSVLGTSSGTLPGARRAAKDGRILRWATIEGSATPTPADPRQVLERPIAEIKSAYQAIGLDFPQPDDGTGAEDARQQEIAKSLGLLSLLELESKFHGV
jgi:phage head maturation protease